MIFLTQRNIDPEKGVGPIVFPGPKCIEIRDGSRGIQSTFNGNHSVEGCLSCLKLLEIGIRHPHEKMSLQWEPAFVADHSLLKPQSGSIRKFTN